MTSTAPASGDDAAFEIDHALQVLRDGAPQFDAETIARPHDIIRPYRQIHGKLVEVAGAVAENIFAEACGQRRAAGDLGVKIVERRNSGVGVHARWSEIKSNDFIMTALGLGCCTPGLIHAILDRASELEGVIICDAVPVYPSKMLDSNFMKDIDGCINHMSGFFSPGGRAQGASGWSDFMPCMTSDAAEKFALQSDVFLCQVTPPNSRGFVNFGLTNFYSMELIQRGKGTGKLRLAIGEVNDQMPVVFGDNWLHVSQFDFFVENSTKIPAVIRATPGEREGKIRPVRFGSDK